jgi:hypothetical protein
MEYLNLPAWVLDSAEFVGADQVERGTWLCLLRYCIGQENGGVIQDCANWKDRQWQQLCRVTLREVRRKSRLFRWEGNLLRVFYYPVEWEAVVKAKRLVAQQNGKMGGRPSKNPQETQPEPTSVISEKAKGNERKGKEMYSPLPPQEGARESADGVISKIKNLRREWAAVPVFTNLEERKFRANLHVFGYFADDDWEVIARFLAARLPEGAAWFQPRMLVRFLENPSGTLAQARAWSEKHRPPLTVVPKPAPPPTAEDAEALADFLKKPTRVNS